MNRIIVLILSLADNRCFKSNSIITRRLSESAKEELNPGDYCCCFSALDMVNMFRSGVGMPQNKILLLSAGLLLALLLKSEALLFLKLMN